MADGVAFRKGNEADVVEPSPSQRSASLRPSNPAESESSGAGEVERITLPAVHTGDGDRVSFSVADQWDRASSPPADRPSTSRTLRRGLAVVAVFVGLSCLVSLVHTLVTGGGLADVIGRSVLAGLGLGVGVGIATTRVWRVGPAARKADRSRAIVLAGDALILERRSRTAGAAELDGSAPPSEGSAVREPRLPIWRMGLHDRFGVTLLSSKQGERLVALITTPTGTFPIATRLTAENEPLFEHLVRGAAEVSVDDNALFAAGPDGQSVVLTPTEFNGFITRLLERDPTCLGRFMLSDQAGRPVLLDDGVLTAQGREFDLRNPVEWRSIQFQEAFGSAVTYYQGTWVRQGANEVVFVSLLSPHQLDMGFGPETGTELGAVETSSSPGAVMDPPPLSQRVAMEGFFVGPMRTALRRAPRSDAPFRRRIVDTKTH